MDNIPARPLDSLLPKPSVARGASAVALLNRHAGRPDAFWHRSPGDQTGCSHMSRTKHVQATMRWTRLEMPLRKLLADPSPGRCLVVSDSQSPDRLLACRQIRTAGHPAGCSRPYTSTKTGERGVTSAFISNLSTTSVRTQHAPRPSRSECTAARLPQPGRSSAAESPAGDA